MTLFLSSFFTVFLLVFQQQNVIHRRYLWASTTSVAITVAQFILIKSVSSGEMTEMLYMSAGGVLGVLSSMYIHPLLIRGKAREDDQHKLTDAVKFSLER